MAELPLHKSLTICSKSLMKYSKTKYWTVLFFLLIFMLSGTETVLPLFSNFFKSETQKEIQINSKTETAGEKASSEKEVEKKECFGLSMFDYDASFKYAFISKLFPPRNSNYKIKVFIAIQTPPPKFIC